MGGVALQVADLARSVAWYTQVLGARVITSSNDSAVLGAVDSTNPLLTLRERARAQRMPTRGRLGLFHVAWLLPDRASLGRFVAHVAARGEPMGSADHLVSEAVYLHDPDGLGVEVYADRPRASWKWQYGEVEMASLPLDVSSLLVDGGGTPAEGLPSGTVIGHVHLHVGDLERGIHFYRDVIGFDVTQSAYPGARFLAAGGYHHHLGTNTWAGASATPPQLDHAQLLQWEILVSSGAALEALSVRAQRSAHELLGSSLTHVALADPWGTRVVVTNAAAK